MKFWKFRIALYITAIVVTAVLTYMFALKTTVNVKNSTIMDDAGLPLVYMTSESGINYNCLHGYTSDVDTTEIRDVITPITKDRTMEIKIIEYTAKVTGISYEIRSMDGSTLVERSTVEDYDQKDDVLTVDFKFRNLLEDKTEYMLKILVSTDEYGNAAYYTRIEILEDAAVDSKLVYVTGLSRDTFSDDTLSSLTSKIDPDSSVDNTNLGRVTIHSTLSQFGFGGMAPEIASDVWPTINEIDGARASITLRYLAKTTEDSTDVFYKVKEYLRINQVDSSVTYVYNFDRWMDQIFNPDTAITSDDDIYFGITSGEDIPVVTDTTGKYTAFIRNNELWIYNAARNSFTKVFSFGSDSGDGLREDYDQHGIKILSLDANGNLKYVVYGYMNRGVHEGSLGESFFEYTQTDSRSTELAFVPRTEPYQIIARDVETLTYINDKNILYFYENGTIYYLDYKTREYMIVADGVIESSCNMSADTALFIYQQGDKAYDCSKVNVLHLDTGTIYKIDASENERIKALGFIDGNIVYGVAKENMIQVNEDGNVNFPMYTVVLMDSDHKQVREYKKADVYVMSTVFDSSKILLNRAKEDAAGNLITIDPDELLSNQQTSVTAAEFYTATTEAREKEVYMTPVVTGTTSNVNTVTGKYSFPSDSSVNISSDTDEETVRSYAYGYGSLYNYGEDLSEVIQGASESGGVVVNGSGQIIWTRYKPNSAEIKLPSSILTPSADTQVAATDALLKIAGITDSSAEIYSQKYSTADCIKKLAGRVQNLTGCSVELVLYFIGQDYPVLAKTGVSTYELIYAYDSTSVTSVDFTTGQTHSYTYADFNSRIASYGDVLMTIGE